MKYTVTVSPRPELFKAINANMLALKSNQVVGRVAKNALCLCLFDGDTFVIRVDLQNVTRANIEVTANIFGNDNAACLVNLPEIGINHCIRFRST